MRNRGVRNARKAIFIACIVMLSACNEAKSDCGRELVFQATDAEVAEIVANRFDASEICYRLEGASTIWYSEKNYGEARKIIFDVFANDLPASRSISFYGKGWNDVLIEKFRSAGIRFEVKIRNGRQWIVWDKESEAEAKRLVDGVDKLASRNKTPNE